MTEGEKAETDLKVEEEEEEAEAEKRVEEVAMEANPDQGQGQEVERGGKEDAPYLTRRKRGKSRGTASILRGTKEN